MAAFLRRAPLARLSLLFRHLRTDGLGAALAFALRESARTFRWRPRDPGERAAERYLRATGHRIVARGWRSPRDRRDEADLLVLTPDRRTLVLVEVKRAAGPWDALERVDRRKREVLWRLLGDLAPADGRAGAFACTCRDVEGVRVDLIGVRGGTRPAIARHLTGLFERRLRRTRAAYFQ